jgi:hypothetical protein
MVMMIQLSFAVRSTLGVDCRDVACSDSTYSTSVPVLPMLPGVLLLLLLPGVPGCAFYCCCC